MDGCGGTGGTWLDLDYLMTVRQGGCRDILLRFYCSLCALKKRKKNIECMRRNLYWERKCAELVICNSYLFCLFFTYEAVNVCPIYLFLSKRRSFVLWGLLGLVRGMFDIARSQHIDLKLQPSVCSLGLVTQYQQLILHGLLQCRTVSVTQGAIALPDLPVVTPCSPNQKCCSSIFGRYQLQVLYNLFLRTIKRDVV